MCLNTSRPAELRGPGAAIPFAAAGLPENGVVKALQRADKEREMIGFVALGIVMLICVLTWDSTDGTELAPPRSPGPESRA